MLEVMIVSSISAFIILFIAKVGILEHMQMSKCKLLSKMAQCDFCLSFWVCVLVTAVMLVLFRDPYLIIVPIMSTPLTRVLV